MTHILSKRGLAAAAKGRAKIERAKGLLAEAKRDLEAIGFSVHYEYPSGFNPDPARIEPKITVKV